MAWKAFFSIIITLFFLIIIYATFYNQQYMFLLYLFLGFVLGYLLYQVAKLYREPTKPIAHGS
jgi:hypothetical protein